MASFAQAYVFPRDAAVDFSQEEQVQVKESFGKFDLNKDGYIELSELRQVLGGLGERPSEAQLQGAMNEADTNRDGKVSFAEFVGLMLRLKKDPAATQSLFSAGSTSKLNRAPAQYSGAMAYHSYSDEERMAFTEHINNCLGRDDIVGSKLPMDPGSEELFSGCADGLLLCKLINLAEFDTIDVRALNVPSERKPQLSIFQKIENMNLALNAAKSIGCVVTNVNAKDIIDGNAILILGLVWQIIRIQLLSSISLTQCPELVCLLEEGEELDDLLALQPEAILLRWFNHHLERAKAPKRIKNFGKDLADGEALSVLLHMLDPAACDLCPETDATAKAAHIIQNAQRMGVETFIQPADITQGNKKLLLAFVAQLFNTNPNLFVEEDVMQQFTADFANLDLDDDGDTREEKVFRMWINSLGIDNGDLYINNLFADVQDGVAILKVMDRIQPGVVSWKRVNLKPKNRYKKVENGNYVVAIAKEMGLTVVNVGGLDIIDGNKKMTLAIMWQLMRRHTLNLLQELSTTDKRIEDPQIVAWANSKVRGMRIRSFQDNTLSTGVFLLQVCHGINRGVVNWELVVMEPETEEDKVNNAKYAISVARKLGALVFVAAEDIVEVRQKMVMLFCASLWHCETQRAKEEEEMGAAARAEAEAEAAAEAAKEQARAAEAQRLEEEQAAEKARQEEEAKDAKLQAEEETAKALAAMRAKQEAADLRAAEEAARQKEAEAEAKQRALAEAEELRKAEESVAKANTLADEEDKAMAVVEAAHAQLDVEDEQLAAATAFTKAQGQEVADSEWDAQA